MLIDDVERLIRGAPGLTATALAQRLFGYDGYHSRVSAECRALVYVKRVERRGCGGPGDPYTYYPVVERQPLLQWRHSVPQQSPQEPPQERPRST